MPPVLIPGLPEWAVYVACGGYLLLEHWLGKTDKVQSGSTLELALNGVKTVLGAVCKPFLKK